MSDYEVADLFGYEPGPGVSETVVGSPLRVDDPHRLAHSGHDVRGDPRGPPDSRAHGDHDDSGGEIVDLLSAGAQRAGLVDEGVD